jgi:hypothetical protein
MREGALQEREKKSHCHSKNLTSGHPLQKRYDSKMNWPTDRRSQYNLNLNIPYIYDYITKLCRQHAEVIQNHENADVHDIRQGKAQQRKYKRLKLGGS